jgi:asparagine synthase (glutamine-hydrolysing)
VSGFAGVFHLDGAPVDRAWLELMSDALAFRGPDGSEVWACGSAGLCHTLSRTSADTDGRPQIASLQGSIRIASDARIDDREALIAKLPSGSADLKLASAADLILHAYAVWGEACVEHLLGDFSFVIWDARRRRVFGARDHLGVRLFYYARIGDCLLISNTLDCIRQLPIVPDELDDRAIGDFLLVGFNKHPAGTYFTAIRRLPVAHRLTAGSDGLRTQRYWTLPIDEPVYYKRPGDYVARFHELLRTAVRDRLPDGPLGILMSGGLDSPALAVASVQLGAATTAFTSVYDRLIPDQERHYAGLVAQHLGIPILYNVRDDEPWGWESDSPAVYTPEPTNPLDLVSHLQFHRDLSARARVFFVGDGPDATLSYEWQRHLAWLIRERRWVRLCRDLGFHIATQRRVPLLPTLPRLWRERNHPDPALYVEGFPPWFNTEFAARVGLRERWEEIREAEMLPHPVRPAAYSSFASDFPMGGADGYDAAFTAQPSDFLHPYWDLRLVRFFLTVPAVPWCRKKYLIRTALRGLIPEAVRIRPKVPLAGFPYLERIRQRGRYPEMAAAGELARYVGIRLPEEHGSTGEEIDQQLRILALNYWLLGVI